MTELPSSLKQFPLLDDWVRINAGATISLFTGKVELGQGIVAALRRIGAEELDLRIDQVIIEPADTDHPIDEGLTAGSQSLEQSGAALRMAAAAARQLMLDMAAAELRVPVGDLTVEDGRIIVPGTERATSYWHLMGGRRFGRSVTEAVRTKAAETYRVVGRPEPRPELTPMVTGAFAYLADLADSTTLHGRIVRPPNPVARLNTLDATVTRRLAGVVAVVHDGSFVGVVAETEHGADRAAARLERDTTWVGYRTLPDLNGPAADEWLRAQPARHYSVVGGVPVELPDPEPTFLRGSPTLAASFSRPFLMHGALGPSVAVARWEGERVTVWSHSQGIHVLRGALARALALKLEQVRVVHVVNAGAYGHNGADDAALDAAVLARATPNHSVMVRWSRRDEHLWEPYGPGMVIDMSASLDATGRVVGWSHEIWSPEHFGRPNRRELLGTLHSSARSVPPSGGNGGVLNPL